MSSGTTHGSVSSDGPQQPLVLITGISGLIGSRIARALALRYRVLGLDVKPPRGDTPWRECDLTDDASVESVLSTVRREDPKLASVIHLAAYYDFSGEPSPLYKKLTVEGTRRLLRELRRFNAVEQFIFSSTLLVMEPVEEGKLLTESSPTAAEWDYPRSKLQAERVIREERGDIPALILRIAGVYDEDCHSVPIAQQIARIHEKRLESYFFPGDAGHGQAFVHLDDLADCFVKAVDRRRELAAHEVLLIAEPDVMSYAELQDRIGELVHDREWPTIRIPKAVAKAGAWVRGKLSSDKEATFIKPWMIDLADTHYPVGIRRAQSLLGWSPSHRLRDTLPEMTARLVRDPQRWYETNGLELPEHIESSA